MRDRKLFYAIDKAGREIHINNTTEEDHFCPHCKERVVAKKGKETIWHFAHKDGVCHGMKKDTKDKDCDLASFQTGKTATIDISDETTFFCPLCRSVGQKQMACKVSENRYICKTCFANTPYEEIKKIL
ncbi:hypothetical protein COV93_07170 [Candidatus Woesearchaeota archaeon CG11_big_fil_rev_8_21_14_0_20_43_8]|nr:MAG: hypothetical protein COV93_07170 [Candidatus Woesearchaeota archaeon CG11_big_fil_rev_8_21_14_0_20_43_8]